MVFVGRAKSAEDLPTKDLAATPAALLNVSISRGCVLVTLPSPTQSTPLLIVR